MSDLANALKQHGHQVSLSLTPSSGQPTAIEVEASIARLLSPNSNVDQVIAVRPPSYGIIHSNKVVWLIHLERTQYDLWGTSYAPIPPTAEGFVRRRAAHVFDAISLQECRSRFTNSRIVQKRLEHHLNLNSEVLYPPLSAQPSPSTRASDNYVVYVSRIVGHKRQALLAQAIKHLSSKLHVVIAGEPSSRDDQRSVETALAQSSSDKFTLLPRWISDSEKVSLLERCRGVIYIPFDEDSYGYPTLEAAAFGKPVITCTDSGGVLEVVQDGVTGLVADPTPESIARAIDMLAEQRLAHQLGDGLASKIDSLNISWEHVIKRLLA